MPPSVRGGDRLPDGCDAVLDPELATGSAPFVEIIETIAPGTHVRLPGHDLAAGEIIAPAGARVDASTALACRVVGIESIEVRSPRVGIDLADAAITRWLAAELDRLGCSMVSADEVADLRLRDASGTGPRLAIRPGEAGWIERSGGEIVIEVPGRFDGAMGAYTFLVLPVLARLFGLSLREIVLPVSAKIASAIGSSDLVLLSATNTALAPLCAGDMPLRAFARASHFLVIPPDSEGLDASTPVAAISLAEPFGFEMASEE